jgi:hypothetical protein
MYTCKKVTHFFHILRVGLAREASKAQRVRFINWEEMARNS